MDVNHSARDQERTPEASRDLGSKETSECPELSRCLLLGLHIQLRDTHDVAGIEVDGGLEGPVSLGLGIRAGATGDVFGALDVSDVRSTVELDRAGVLG